MRLEELKRSKILDCRINILINLVHENLPFSWQTGDGHELRGRFSHSLLVEHSFWFQHIDGEEN